MKLEDLRPEQMARACKVSRRTWFNWMANPEKMTLYDLQKIATKLRVKKEDLVRENEKI